jgi:hypothetical protein
MFKHNAKIERIFIFLVLQQLEWRIVPLLIIDIDAKEGKDVDKIGRNYRRRSDAI